MKKKKRDENYQLEMLEGAKLIGAGAATIASAGAAIGIGNVLSSSIHSVARNPSLAKQSFGYAFKYFTFSRIFFILGIWGMRLLILSSVVSLSFCLFHLLGCLPLFWETITKAVCVLGANQIGTLFGNDISFILRCFFLLLWNLLEIPLLTAGEGTSNPHRNFETSSPAERQQDDFRGENEPLHFDRGGEGSPDPRQGGSLADAVRPFLGAGRAPGAGPSDSLPQIGIHNLPNREVGGPEDVLRDALLVAKEQGAADRDPVYEAVQAINAACEQEEGRILQKTRSLLEKKGITLEDPKDLNRAVNVAMTEAWEIDIDDRLSHFRRLRRYFGTRNCTLWPDIKDQLRSLGVPDEDD